MGDVIGAANNGRSCQCWSIAMDAVKGDEDGSTDSEDGTDIQTKDVVGLELGGKGNSGPKPFLLVQIGYDVAPPD